MSHAILDMLDDCKEKISNSEYLKLTSEISKHFKEHENLKVKLTQREEEIKTLDRINSGQQKIITYQKRHLLKKESLIKAHENFQEHVGNVMSLTMYGHSMQAISDDLNEALRCFTEIRSMSNPLHERFEEPYWRLRISTEKINKLTEVWDFKNEHLENNIKIDKNLIKILETFISKNKKFTPVNIHNPSNYLQSNQRVELTDDESDEDDDTQITPSYPVQLDSTHSDWLLREVGL